MAFVSKRDSVRKSDLMKNNCCARSYQYSMSISLRLLLSLCLGVVLWSCTPAIAGEQVSPAVLSLQIEQDSAPLILDVRTPEEYAEGHVPGAVNIEYRQIPVQVETLRAYEDKTVVVYCERGVRAGRAEAALVEAGFTSVVELSGDMVAWRAAGLPIEMGRESLTP